MVKALSHICEVCSDEESPGDGLFLGASFLNPNEAPEIPLCRGCGGLGVQFDCDDFKARVVEIDNLCKESQLESNIKNGPVVLRLIATRKLLEMVKELLLIYGSGLDNAFAIFFVSEGGPTEEVIEALEQAVAANIKALEKFDNSFLPVDARKPTLEALIKMYSGDIDEGIEMLEKVMEKFPNCSNLYHDYAMILHTFKKDYVAETDFLIKATTLEPKYAEFFLDAATALARQKRSVEGAQYLIEMKKQDDYWEYKLQNPMFNIDYLIDVFSNRPEVVNSFVDQSVTHPN